MPAYLMRPHFFGKVSCLPNGHGRTVFASTKCFDSSRVTIRVIEMYVLGIESTCDETAAAIVEDGRKVISNVISTSVK